MRYCQMVIGPAGSGKSTFCQTIQQHCDTVGRNVHVANLDPAADKFNYTPAFDIRDLISLEEVMSELKLGPNGALVYCMEHLSESIDWIGEQVDEYPDDYLILDCPGQIELYGHIPVMADIARELVRKGYRVCSVYVLDSQFIADPSKFIAGVMSCLAAMVRLELPNVSVLTKCDLLGSTRGLSRFANPDPHELTRDLEESTPPRFRDLNDAIATLIDEYAMVSFQTLDRRDQDSIELVLAQIDNAMGYGEDEEVNVVDDFTGPEED